MSPDRWCSRFAGLPTVLGVEHTRRAGAGTASGTPICRGRGPRASVGRAPATPPPDPADRGPGGDDSEGPEVPTADGDPVPAPRSPLDERAMRLIHYCSTPDRWGAD